MPGAATPLHHIPFSDDLGDVVRKAVLPAILADFQRAREADLEGNRSGERPSGGPPSDPEDA